MRVNWWSNFLDEKDTQAVVGALNARKITQGSITEEFESALAKYLGAPYVVCVSSGSSALAAAYLACGLRVGDEILTSNVTFVATANAALLLGGVVNSVDVNDKGVMDVSLLESKITKNTKIIVPVHMNGVCVEMEPIYEIAEKYDLDIVEDAAQTFGSKYSHNTENKGRFLGALSRFGCFSLGMAKNLTTGSGGFIVAHTKEDADMLKRIRNQGVFDVRKESHYSQFGFNFKYMDLLAAIGLRQLEIIDEKLQNVRNIYNFYKKELGGIFRFLESDIENGEVPMRIVVLTDKNKEIFERLQRGRIQCALESEPLNQCGYTNIKGDFPKSNYFESHKLILPSGPNFTIEEAKIVCEEIKKMKDV